MGKRRDGGNNEDLSDDYLGYFLLFECMLESIIYARKTYLDTENGLGKSPSIDIEMMNSHFVFHSSPT
jgi:hypothetical protein